MTISKPVKYGILIAAGLGISAIATYVIMQINKLKNACYTITGGMINNLTLSNVQITLFLKVKNISDFTIELNFFDLSIFVNNTLVSTVNQSVNQQILSQAYTTIRIPISFSPDDLLKAGTQTISKILTDKSQVIIRTTGTVSVTAGLVTVSNYKIDDSISLQQITDGTKSDHC